MISLVCAECGNSFDAWPYEVRKGRRFCSHRCKSIAGSRLGNAGRQAQATYGPDSQGYPKAPGGERAHRKVAEAALGRQLRPGEVVHHRNGDRTDNRPENLEVLPNQSTHMRLHAREFKNGAEHHCARLTQDQADEIRDRRRMGETGVSLAAEFHISPATVSAITRGHRYSPKRKASTA